MAARCTAWMRTQRALVARLVLLGFALLAGNDFLLQLPPLVKAWVGYERSSSAPPLSVIAAALTDDDDEHHAGLGVSSGGRSGLLAAGGLVEPHLRAWTGVADHRQPIVASDRLRAALPRGPPLAA